MLLLLSHFSRVRLCATPEMAAYQAPMSLGFSRQEHWSGMPLLTGHLLPATLASFSVQFSCSVTSNSATPWTAARHTVLSITNSQSLLKLMSIESVMPSNHLILCRHLSPSAFNLSQHQGLCQWVSSSHRVAKVLEFQLQHQSFQWILRIDFP